VRSEQLAMAAPLVRSGQLKYRDDIVEGIHNAPAALIGLLKARILAS
jgi:NADPH-dependent curcumin reductase CurA